MVFNPIREDSSPQTHKAAVLLCLALGKEGNDVELLQHFLLALFTAVRNGLDEQVVDDRVVAMHT